MLKSILRFSLIIIALLVICVIAILGLAHNANFATKTMLPFIAEKTGVPITASYFNLDSFSQIETKDFKIDKMDGLSFDSKKADLKISLIKLLGKKIELKKLLLEEPILTFKSSTKTKEKSKEKDSQKENSQKNSSKKNAFAISLQNATIKNGSINIDQNKVNGLGLKLKADISKKTKVDLLINELTASNALFNGTSLSGVELKLKAKTLEQAAPKTIAGDLSISEIKTESLAGAFGIKTNFDTAFDNESIKINALTIDGAQSQKRFINLTAKGDITKDLHSKESKLTIASKQLALSQVFKLLKIDVSPPKAKKGDSKAPKEVPEVEASNIEPKIELPKSIAKLWLDADLNIENISFEDILVKSAKAKLKAKQSNFSLNNIFLENKTSKLNANVNLDLSGSLAGFKLDAKTNLIKVADLNQRLSIDENRELAGEIKDLSLLISAKGLSQSAIEKNAIVNFSTKLKDIDFDHNLEGIIPFNLIFLPFNTLAKIAELTPIPPPAMGPLKGIIEFLQNLTKLHCDKGSIIVKKQGADIILEEATFDMAGILPDLKLPGKIGITNKKIKINSKLKILGAWIPMPLKGTVDLAYPDIPVFAKELVLSVVKGPGDLIGGLTGGDKKSN